MMKYVMIVLLVVLSGCSEESIQKRSAARHAAFVQCMELAAKNKRAGDDDVSDIISECSDVSYSLTIHVK